MRILHILDHSLPIGSGYSYRSQSILDAQRAHGLDVVAVTGLRHARPGPNPDWQEGLPFHRTRGWVPPLPLMREAGEVAWLAGRVLRMSRKSGVDILHAHSPVLNGLAGLRAARRLRLPLVYEVRAFWEDAAVDNGTGRASSLRYAAIQRAETWLARQADAVIAISSGIADDLAARGVDPDKIICVPNGVPPDFLTPPSSPDAGLAARLGLRGREVIGFIGSLYTYEGLEDLIAAFPAILARRPGVSLLIVGGGPAEQQLRDQAAASPARHHIHLTGRVAQHEVPALYSLLDLALYPRRRSRLTELVTPLKPLEAMAQGRLVLASDVGGHRELIRSDQTGLLFPANNPQALATAVLDVLADQLRRQRLRMGGLAYVHAERSWHDLATRYLPVYHRLCTHAMDWP